VDHSNGEWVNDRTHGQQFKARFLRERTDPFRSAVPIDPDQWFRLIPITDSG